MKPLVDPQAPVAENEALEKMELVLASLDVPIKAIPPPSQGSEASDTASQQPSKDKLTIKLKNRSFPFICTTIVSFFLLMKLPFFCNEMCTLLSMIRPCAYMIRVVTNIWVTLVVWLILY